MTYFQDVYPRLCHFPALFHFNSPPGHFQAGLRIAPSPVHTHDWYLTPSTAGLRLTQSLLQAFNPSTMADDRSMLPSNQLDPQLFVPPAATTGSTNTSLESQAHAWQRTTILRLAGQFHTKARACKNETQLLKLYRESRDVILALEGTLSDVAATFWDIFGSKVPLNDKADEQWQRFETLAKSNEKKRDSKDVPAQRVMHEAGVIAIWGPEIFNHYGWQGWPLVTIRKLHQFARIVKDWHEAVRVFNAMLVHREESRANGNNQALKIGEHHSASKIKEQESPIDPSDIKEALQWAKTNSESAEAKQQIIARASNVNGTPIEDCDLKVDKYGLLTPDRGRKRPPRRDLIVNKAVPATPTPLPLASRANAVFKKQNNAVPATPSSLPLASRANAASKKQQVRRGHARGKASKLAEEKERGAVDEEVEEEEEVDSDDKDADGEPDDDTNVFGNDHTAASTGTEKPMDTATSAPDQHGQDLVGEADEDEPMEDSTAATEQNNTVGVADENEAMEDSTAPPEQEPDDQARNNPGSLGIAGRSKSGGSNTGEDDGLSITGTEGDAAEILVTLGRAAADDQVMRDAADGDSHEIEGRRSGEERDGGTSKPDVQVQVDRSTSSGHDADRDGDVARSKGAQSSDERMADAEEIDNNEQPGHAPSTAGSSNVGLAAARSSTTHTNAETSQEMSGSDGTTDAQGESALPSRGQHPDIPTPSPADIDQINPQPSSEQQSSAGAHAPPGADSTAHAGIATTNSLEVRRTRMAASRAVNQVVSVGHGDGQRAGNDIAQNSGARLDGQTDLGSKLRLLMEADDSPSDVSQLVDKLRQLDGLGHVRPAQIHNASEDKPKARKESADVWQTAWLPSEQFFVRDFLTKPMIIKQSFQDSALYNQKKLLTLITERHSKQTIDVRRSATGVPTSMTLLDYAQAMNSSNTPPAGVALKVESIIRADEPLLTRLPRFRLLQTLVGRSKCSAEGSSLQGLSNLLDSLNFTLYSHAGVFTSSPTDSLFGTWVRCLSGSAMWIISPPLNKTSWQQYLAGEASWPRNAEARILLLEKDDVLVIPSGMRIARAVFVPEACTMEGGSFWDECSIPEVIDGLIWTKEHGEHRKHAVFAQLPRLVDELEAWVEEGHSDFGKTGKGLAEYRKRVRNGIDALRRVLVEEEEVERREREGSLTL
ncbi:unnamed protein product [Zymoseptoria tritici ST99CH_1A5]|uniref:JmjC domain-containing protein n=1 Tax=Zymoseptoria tritici ST99CH_1A5 TaxID=1276529 RepID=A0A1Y6M0U6_ZYMTR|nr:unnamed protein product [Zymoseptoria tritici ST99CH_1A5]